jgi:hypothetical protein
MRVHAGDDAACFARSNSSRYTSTLHPLIRALKRYLFSLQVNFPVSSCHIRSFRYDNSTNFFAVSVRKLQIRNFLRVIRKFKMPLVFQIKKNTSEPFGHRVGRVLSFSPVVGIRGGAHSLAREGLYGIESKFRRGDMHCGTLYVYVLRALGNPDNTSSEDQNSLLPVSQFLIHLRICSPLALTLLK